MTVIAGRMMKLPILMIVSLLWLLEIRHHLLKLLNPINLLLDPLLLRCKLPSLPDRFHSSDLLIPIFLFLVKPLRPQLILILKVWIHTVFNPLDMT